jgi:hypothetical protein
LHLSHRAANSCAGITLFKTYGSRNILIQNNVVGMKADIVLNFEILAIASMQALKQLKSQAHLSI